MPSFLYELISLPCLSKAKLRMQREKRGREVPGPLKKVLGLLDFFSPGTTGPSRSLGPALSRPGTFPGLPGTGKSCCQRLSIPFLLQ